ncbi:hypothetical protein Lal_00042186 [Lupinus albus]|nr:hypothetical protein Lal_00042186 [Lupinus albus]
MQKLTLDIAELLSGSIMVTGQWFYRPEEVERKGGGSWQSHDTRELFYSFHRDEVPAEPVMHKCVKGNWKLTDKDYEDGMQQEMMSLFRKPFNVWVIYMTLKLKKPLLIRKI